MQLRDAIQDFMLECKVRRLVPRTIDNYGKHLRYLTDYLTAEYQVEKLEEVRSAHIKKFLLMKEEQGCKPHYINDLLKASRLSFATAQRKNISRAILQRECIMSVSPR